MVDAATENARSPSLVLASTVAAVLVVTERRDAWWGQRVVDKLNQIAEIWWTVVVKYTVHDGGDYHGIDDG